MFVGVQTMPRPSPVSPRRSPAASDACRAPESGVALVMALIFSILLYILVAELVVSSRMVRSTGENDALLARMNTLMLYELGEAEDKLLADTAGGAAGGEGAGGLGALLGGEPGAEGGGPGEEGEVEEDPTTTCDSSRDAWYEPTGHPDNDLTTYVWIEDENRKFNLLTIWSPDEEFAQASREGLTRLIDTLRQDTEWDVASSDAALMVQEIVDWARRPATESMPVPPLKSRDEADLDFAIPLHLDELMLLPSIDAELFFDKVIDQKVHLGLESVLTIWTSLVPDPGDPEKLARQRAIDAAAGRAPADPPAGEEGGGAPGEEGGEGEEEELRQPEGVGIKVNVNTATWPVLRGVLPEGEVPDRVIDGIIRYRNEVDEEATQEATDSEAEEASDFGDLMLGTQPLKQFFESLDDLEEVEEFAQIPDEKIKAMVMNRLTVNSDVFSIHIASLFKRNDSERKRIYLLRRARSIVLRLDDGEEGKIVPIVPFEERVGLRVQPVDMQDEVFQDFGQSYLEMDQFSQEERAWNPFLVDFYLPPDVRQSFFSNR